MRSIRSRPLPASGKSQQRPHCVAVARPAFRNGRLRDYLYDGVLPPDQSSFEIRLAIVEEGVQRALSHLGRSRSDLTLVAVSKKFSSENILIAYRSGLRHFGENYVQEFGEKRRKLGELPDATYHLIGHLQSNKA